MKVSKKIQHLVSAHCPSC